MARLERSAHQQSVRPLDRYRQLAGSAELRQPLERLTDPALAVREGETA
jgi:hypothetical protein